MNTFGRFARSFGFVIVLLVVYGAFSIAAPSFFGMANLIDILHVVAPLVVVAAGMSLVVISGRLDISVGSIAYVASAVFALFMRDGHTSFSLALVAALATGVVLGVVNGMLVVGLQINALITTLGTMIAFRGFGLWLTNGGLVEMPAAVKPLGHVMWGPVYLDTILALTLLLFVHLVHRRTTLGRQLTAMGNDEAIARRVGIPVRRRTFAVLVFSGLLAAVAGVMYTMQVAISTAKIGEGMEFATIAAIVVGGISLFGGRGNIATSVILGTLAFQMIRSGLQHIGANPYSYRLVEGVVIFVAMYADALKAERVGLPRLAHSRQGI